jgi:hypothetical protein
MPRVVVYNGLAELQQPKNEKGKHIQMYNSGIGKISINQKRRRPFTLDTISKLNHF